MKTEVTIGTSQKITPFLWFNGEAEKAAKFYTSVFKNSKITGTSAMTTTFVIEGQNFIALNGGPEFKFTEAVSFFVSCDTQEEIDYFWDKLSEGGQTQPCGWLKDKFGLSWQIVPKVLGELYSQKDRKKADRTFQAMMKMKKLIIKDLVEA